MIGVTSNKVNFYTRHYTYLYVAYVTGAIIYQLLYSLLVTERT
jgi:hypothetical protein